MIPDEPLAFADVLKSFRVGAGLSQEQLAERARLSARGISDLERGARRVPRLQTVRMLADALRLAQTDRNALFDAARPPHASAPYHGRPLPPVRSHVRLPPTPLVGREQELDVIVDLLAGSGSRLLTLTGPGGVGKTRLALEAMPRLAAHYPEGVHLVELDRLTDASLVDATVARALGIHVPPTIPVFAALEDVLHDQRLVIVLDNAEHVVAGAEFISRLIATCLGVTVLTTSRTPLSLRGERQLHVRPLNVPGVETERSLEDLGSAESVQLFVARVRDITPEFSLSGANAGAVAEICRRLDGLPLALELAASRIRILPPTTLVRRLHQSLTLLTTQGLDLPERHRTLRSTIAWSYKLLSPRHQVLFRRLGVFAGSWTLQAAAWVTACDGLTELELIDGIEALVRASLVQEATADIRALRFGMMETVREFAREEMELNGEWHEMSQRHADYVLSLARPGAMNGADDRQANLKAEQPNLRVALAWLRDQGRSSDGLRLAASLGPYWRQVSAHTEGRSWLETFLDMTNADDSLMQERVEAMRWAGELAAFQGDPAAAERYLRESLRHARSIDDRRSHGAVHGAMASALIHRGDVAESVDHLEHAIALARMAGDRRQMAYLLAQQAFAEAHGGDLEQAEACATQSDMLLRALDVTWSFENAFLDLVHGWMALVTGQSDHADVRLTMATALGKALGARSISSFALAGMGEAALRQGRIAEATAAYRDGLVLGREGNYPLGITLNLQGLVRIAVQRGDLERAARLAGATGRFGNAMLVLPGIFRGQYEYAVLTLRSTLGDAVFSGEQMIGRTLPLDDLISQELATQNPYHPALGY